MTEVVESAPWLSNNNQPSTTSDSFSFSATPVAEPAASNAAQSQPAESGNGNGARKRKSRWDSGTAKTFVPGIPSMVPVQLNKEQTEAFLLRIRIDELTHKLTAAQIELAPEHERSPSPPPIYDAHGKRLNTREVRVREHLMRERQRCVERAQEIFPLFRPPADYKPLQVKKSRKLYIPIKQHPEYNFIGLIIGPRGTTQKEMERETGAKIAIRGRGSVKDGKKADRLNFGDDDELHVLVQADTDESLERASALVAKLLVPVEEGKNEHKRQQLRKLAEYNGTLRDQSWRRQEELAGKAHTGIDVTCGICGEVSHPTADCPLKGQSGVKSKLEREYENFLAEIGETKTEVASAQPTGAGDAYEEFMASLGDSAGAPKPAVNAAANPAAPWLQTPAPGQQPPPPPPPPPPQQAMAAQQQQQQQQQYYAAWQQYAQYYGGAGGWPAQ